MVIKKNPNKGYYIKENWITEEKEIIKIPFCMNLQEHIEFQKYIKSLI
jgi:hypothetical protein